MYSALHEGLCACRTQIVGYSKETVGDIRKCINNWIIAGKETGQSLTLGGSNLTVSPLTLPFTIISILIMIRSSISKNLQCQLFYIHYQYGCG